MKNVLRLVFAAGLMLVFSGCGALNPFTVNSFPPQTTADIPLATQSEINQMYYHLDNGQMEAATSALQNALSNMDNQVFGDNRRKLAALDHHYRRNGKRSIWDIALDLDKRTQSGKNEALTIMDELRESDTRTSQDSRPLDRDLHRFIQSEIRSVAIAMGEDRDFELPRDFVYEIEYYIRKFQTDEKYREFFTNSLRRSRKYIPALRHHFTERGFPEEIMYLAFVESAFNPSARSKANAVGMFQFIASTGREYGLKINRSIDERKSPHRAAEACAEYLQDLLLELGSFTLALSSYNSGSGKTRQALRQLDSFHDRSFWTVREQTSVLRNETREYVPQIFAAIVAARPGNPKRFGLPDVAEINSSAYRSVIVPQSTALATIATALSISQADLIALNPDLTSDATTTPKGVIDYPLFVPRNKEQAAIAFFGKRTKPSVTATRRSKTTRTADAQTPIFHQKSGGVIEYRVQSGNTLSHLAGWFGCSIANIKSWNPALKKRGLRVGDRVTIKVPRDNWSVSTHIVGNGETIGQIARKYAVKERSIRSWNGTGNVLHAQQKLVIYHQRTASKKDRQAQPQLASMAHFTGARRQTSNKTSADGAIEQRQKIAKGESFSYAVKSGNTLGEIAKFFEVTVKDIQRWNRLSNTYIRNGQRLKIISGNAFRYYKYRVASGDTYQTIANRFSTSQLSVRITNGKYRASLRAGELLTIFSKQQ